MRKLMADRGGDCQMSYHSEIHADMMERRDEMAAAFDEPEPIDYYEPLWQKLWEEALNGNDPFTRDSDWSKERMRFLCLTYGAQVEEVKQAEAAARSLEICPLCGSPKVKADGSPHGYDGAEGFCEGPEDTHPHANHTEPCGADCIPF